MDPIFVIGLLVTLVAIVVSTLLDGNSLSVLIGPSSALLVVLGTLGAGVMAYRRSEIATMPRSIGKALRADVPDVRETITALATLAETARRDGMLALETRLEEVDDRFVHLGLQLLVDGADEDVVRETLEIEIAATDERHRTAIAFFKTLAGYAPTFGMIGTVIGLVNMLGNLSDPSQLGKGMAMALLTTLYGVLLANLIFSPLAARLQRLNEVEMAALDVTVDGIMTIRGGASPRVLVERLEAYLPPSQRLGVSDRFASPRGASSGEAA